MFYKEMESNMFYKVLRTENLGSERGRTLDITETHRVSQPRGGAYGKAL